MMTARARANGRNGRGPKTPAGKAVGGRPAGIGAVARFVWAGPHPKTFKSGHALRRLTSAPTPIIGGYSIYPALRDLRAPSASPVM